MCKLDTLTHYIFVQKDPKSLALNYEGCARRYIEVHPYLYPLLLPPLPSPPLPHHHLDALIMSAANPTVHTDCQCHFHRAAGIAQSVSIIYYVIV